MAMMDAQEGRPLPYPPQQRPETAVRREKKAEANEERAATAESEKPEPKAAGSTLRNKRSRKMKLVMPKAGAGGSGTAPTLSELDRNAPVSKSHLELIREGQEFPLG